MSFLLLNGGYGIDGSSGIVVNIIRDRLNSMGQGSDLFRNDEKILPQVGAPGCWDSTEVKLLKNKAMESSGIILVSPEYHGTMSSIMKLQLDWLSKEELGGKPVALVSLLGGEANTSTLNHMRHVCRWLGAWCIPEQIAIPHGRRYLEEGDLTDRKLSDRLHNVLSSLVDFTKMLTD